MSLLMEMLSNDRLEYLINNIQWYHTFALPNGLKTKAVYDHSHVINSYGFPDSLHGKKVLDVGSSDGFFSFEFEKKSALSVTAIDTNKYDGSVAIDPSPAHHHKYQLKYSKEKAFVDEFSDVLNILQMKGLNRLLIVKDLLDSKVEFINMSVYELNSLINQKYELVFCGDLIEHLKNPLGAIENLAKVTGELCIISLSSALYNSRFTNHWLKKTFMKGISLLKLHGDLIDTSGVVKYMGNFSGGSFFHFHPSAFKEALLASGFKEVKIKAEFDLYNLKWNCYNHHVIFHCYIDRQKD